MRFITQQSLLCSLSEFVSPQQLATTQRTAFRKSTSRIYFIPGWLTVCLCLASTALGADYTLFRSGIIATEETWSGSVLVTGDIVITNGGRLTVMPGTTVFADALSDDQIGGEDRSRVEISISGGTLVADGTESAPIRFTVTPRSEGAEPTPGDWSGLRWKATRARLSYCSISYGAIGLHALVTTFSAQSCSFEKNVSAGMSAIDNCALVDCSFSANQNMGFAGGRAHTFERCRFLDNGGGGLQSRQVLLKHCLVAGNMRGGGNVGPKAYGAIDGTAGDNGVGGIVSDVYLDHCTVTNNYSPGVCSVQGGSVFAQDSLVAFNAGAGIGEVYSGFSGCIMRPSFVAVTNCQILSNGGSGINSGQITVVSSVISSNISGLVISPDCWGQYIGPLLVRNSQISDHRGVGVTCYRISEFAGNVVRDNKSGLEIRSTEAIETLGGYNSFYGNLPYEVINKGTAAIIADGSYWGEPTLSELKQHQRNLTRIYDVKDDAAVGQVVIRSWLDAPPRPPVITEQPISQAVAFNSMASLSVSAVGLPPLTYQWYEGSQGDTSRPVAEGRSPTLTTPVLLRDTAFWVRVSNPEGSADSQVAKITVVLRVWIIPPVRVPGRFALDVPAAVAGLWQLEVSDDLVHWEAVAGQSPVDAAAANPTLELLGEAEPHRFFRLTLLP